MNKVILIFQKSLIKTNMAKLTTDKALSILIDSEQAKKVLKPSYIRQVKHRLKTGKNLELSKKIEILEKLGAVANELTWNVKTNRKTDFDLNDAINATKRPSLAEKFELLEKVQIVAMSSDPTDLI